MGGFVMEVSLFHSHPWEPGSGLRVGRRSWGPEARLDARELGSFGLLAWKPTSAGDAGLAGE